METCHKRFYVTNDVTQVYALVYTRRRELQCLHLVMTKYLLIYRVMFYHYLLDFFSLTVLV